MIQTYSLIKCNVRVYQRLPESFGSEFDQTVGTPKVSMKMFRTNEPRFRESDLNFGPEIPVMDVNYKSPIYRMIIPSISIEITGNGL